MRVDGAGRADRTADGLIDGIVDRLCGPTDEEIESLEAADGD